MSLETHNAFVWPRIQSKERNYSWARLCVMRALQYNCFSCEFTTNDSHFMYFFGYPSIHYQFIFIFGVLVVSLANSKQIEWSITRTCTVWPLISASNILTNLESKIKSNQGTYEYPGISLMDGSYNASYLANL